MICAKDIEIRGVVQGVGFRPFVYRLAKSLDLKGRVLNSRKGVFIHVEGGSEKIKTFAEKLYNCPRLADIWKIELKTSQVRNFSSFNIEESSADAGQKVSAIVPPDICVCENCLKELLDPKDRRYRYPFINCTDCGPRYTITYSVPYDRPYTSMKNFKMCEKCQTEYDDPYDRRFHAQPNACPVCGPKVWLVDKDGNKIAADDPVLETAKLLKKGAIVAIKGIGGFHLAADAQNDLAVVRLRQQKPRPFKPFAIMSYRIDDIAKYAFIEPFQKKIIESFQRPIVLLKKRENPQIALSKFIAPNSRFLGVMLPYTPLHFLIMEYGFAALVMTSGNVSSEPIIKDNEDALLSLKDTADYFLVNDRPIYMRADDSVIKTYGKRAFFIRRSRGYVPGGVLLCKKMPEVIGFGADIKNTLCITKGDMAFLSQHIGDLKSAKAYELFIKTAEHLKKILDLKPIAAACDMHPGYVSSCYARELKNIMNVIEVQHHHAHIVSCMAENMINGPVIGAALDGTGYGTDGNIWGGEVLVADLKGFVRKAHISYAKMPGADKAVQEPWRMGISYLYDAFGPDFKVFDMIFGKLNKSKDEINILVKMIEKGINCPKTSSLGRLFDGVSALCGLCFKASYQGQAAIELETAAEDKTHNTYGFEKIAGEIKQICLSQIIKGVVEDIKIGKEVGYISAKFHATVIKIFHELFLELRDETKIEKAVLSGGVFQNALILSGLKDVLKKDGFDVYKHKHVPPGDGGIALGQAVSACSRL